MAVLRGWAFSILTKIDGIGVMPSYLRRPKRGNDEQEKQRAPEERQSMATKPVPHARSPPMGFE
ncbi:MAG: hypothetical protein QOJ59_1638 [Thermomicrobiales bacterium]|nr:hypothetical protein [Thermomicrobiales bacterium]